jgi:hypothetical protein
MVASSATKESKVSSPCRRLYSRLFTALNTEPEDVSIFRWLQLRLQHRMKYCRKMFSLRQYII